MAQWRSFRRWNFSLLNFKFGLMVGIRAALGSIEISLSGYLNRAVLRRIVPGFNGASVC